MTHRIQVDGSIRRRIVGILVELKTNTGCVTAEQDKIDSASLLVGAANREGISRQNAAHLGRGREIICRILLCR
jgi:hypothetical protein